MSLNKKIYWHYIALSFISLFVLGMLDNIRGPLFPLILKDLQLKDDLGSYFFAVASFTALLTNFASLWIYHYFSLTSLLRWGLLILGASVFIIGLSSNYVQLIAGASLLGISFGWFNHGQNLGIQYGSTEPHRRQLFSGLHSMYGLASLLAPSLIGGMIQFGLSWNLCFRIFAGVAGLAFILSFFIRGETSHIEEQQRGEGRVKVQLISRSLPHQIWIGLALGLAVVGEVALSTRLPLYLIRELNFTPAEASYALTGFFVALLSTRLLMTFVHIPLSNTLVLLLSSALAIICSVIGLQGHPALLLASGVFIGPIYPVVMALCGQIFHQELGKVTSVLMTISSLMMVTMHVVLGDLSQVLGIRLALWISPISLMIAFFLFLTRSRVFRHEAA